jgi:hypothetical protein
VRPFEGESFQGQGDKCLKLVIDFQESGWYGLYHLPKPYEWHQFDLPKEAAEVELSWEWFVPTTAKWDKVPVAPKEGYVGPPPGKVWVGEPGPGAATHKVCLPDYVEGAWRVAARHLGPGWPWSQWRQFWIGEPVAYGNPSPVIVLPKEGAYYPNPLTGTGGYVYPVDVLVEYTKTVQKATGQDLKQKQNVPIEAVMDRSHPKDTGGYWVTYAHWTDKDSKISGQTFTTNLQEGRWRARARLKVAGTIKQPWSDWTVFYVGPAGLALLQEDKAKQPGFHLEPPKIRVK